MTQTYTTPNKGFEVPEVDSDDWGDDMQEIVNEIDTYLNGIGIRSINKDNATFDSVSVESSVVLTDGTPISYGDNGEFTLSFDGGNNTLKIIDTTTGDVVLSTGTNDDGITVSRQLQKASGVNYASEPYADTAASEAVSGDISPNSVDANSYNGIRMFSSFMDSSTPLQDAADWCNHETASDNRWSMYNAGAVFIDGIFEIDEPTVELRKRSKFFGMGMQFSRLEFTRDTSNPVFVDGTNPDTGNAYGLQQHLWENVHFQDKQPTPRDRPFLKQLNGSLGQGTYLRNLFFEDFGGVNPFEVQNPYGSTFDTIWMRTKDSDSHGHFKFNNANACNIENIKSIGDCGPDTPAISFFNCTGSNVIGAYLEDVNTDTMINISNSSLSFVHPYGEGPGFNCAIQIGDGGLTHGNRDGSTKLSSVTIHGGLFRSANDYEGVRLLNVDEATFINLQMGGASPSYNYMGSNNSNHTNLSTDVRDVLIMGDNNANVINNGDNNRPHVIILRPHVHYNDSTMDGNEKYSLGFGHTTSGGPFSMAYKRDDGTTCVWDANRTI